ncbi:hypothetical protein NM688_g9384 [Phlebia brevispora]|uniref:Uncharacterized protein n=1 Tax=Phlebia brevispora TaxID=194682 RepID=A0ACC1RHI9_9APHY|nr:hypothetical protein NM688_g9384 [Phlebia brevispora]
MSDNENGKNALLSTLVVVGNDYRLTRAFWSASLALTIYDTLLTLGDEVWFFHLVHLLELTQAKVTYMWTTRLTRTHILYWLNRFWPLSNLLINNIYTSVLSLEHPTDKSRTFRGMGGEWTDKCDDIAAFASLIAILILRIYAMYDRNKRILWVLLTCLIGELIAELIMVGFIAVRLQTAHLPAPFTGCIPTHIAPWVWIYWLPMSIFESCLFLLAVAKAAQLTYTGEGRAPSLLVVLLRDSIIFYGGVLSVILTNFIVWKVGRPSLFATFLSTVFAAHCMLGCRILLNIQRAVHEQRQEETAVFTTVDSGPELALQAVKTGNTDGHELSLIIDPV